MIPDKLPNRLRSIPALFRFVGGYAQDCIDAADLIEKQAKALEEVEKALAYAVNNGEWSHEETTLLGEAIAAIRAARGETVVENCVFIQGPKK